MRGLTEVHLSEIWLVLVRSWLWSFWSVSSGWEGLALAHSPCHPPDPVHRCGSMSAVTCIYRDSSALAYLVRFKVRSFGGLTITSGCLTGASMALEGGSGFGCSLCFSTSCLMFVILKACGILLTRISSRARSPCACRAYCARSLRARSVTNGLVSRAL